LLFQRGGVHIIVATPGRLIDFVNRGLITFSSLRFFVLDEADRMLDMGFSLDIERILNDNTMVSSVNSLIFILSMPNNNITIIYVFICIHICMLYNIYIKKKKNVLHFRQRDQQLCFQQPCLWTFNI
jgi:superfamily II DNA/RNA helicase